MNLEESGFRQRNEKHKAPEAGVSGVSEEQPSVQSGLSEGEKGESDRQQGPRLQMSWQRF